MKRLAGASSQRRAGLLSARPRDAGFFLFQLLPELSFAGGHEPSKFVRINERVGPATRPEPRPLFFQIEKRAMCAEEYVTVQMLKLGVGMFIVRNDLRISFVVEQPVLVRDGKAA